MIFSPRGLSRPTRLALVTGLLLLLYFLTCILLPAVHYRARRLYAHAPFDLAEYANKYDSELHVNLIVASRAKDDTSWTSKLNGLVPNLHILRYVSDSATAEYQPAVLNKGREALIYFTYIHSFYDELPDISIFVHSHEHPWHLDSALRQSLPFALIHLDLEQVQKRGYYNLRPSWHGACTAWINTTKTVAEGHVKEEGYVGTAFRDNFGSNVPVPEILAGPCCSQFAVSKDVIRKVSKEQYKRHIDWLVKMSDVWGDYLTGRTWEHMWPFLFMGQTKDCPVERESFCRMYHICFKDNTELHDYQKLWAERDDLKESLASASAFFQDVTGSKSTRDRKRRIAEIQEKLEEKLESALARGSDPATREQTTRNLHW